MLRETDSKRTDRQKDIYSERQTVRETHIQRDRQSERQTVREADSQIVRKTERLEINTRIANANATAAVCR